MEPQAFGRPRVVPLRDPADVRRALGELGVSKPGIEIMSGKALLRAVRVDGVDGWTANILKQEMLARGGDVAMSRELYRLGADTADCLVIGTLLQHAELAAKLKSPRFGLSSLAEDLEAVLAAHDRIPSTHEGLDLSRRPVIMGILNVTPDSFSDGGDFFGADAAVAEAYRMVDEGAALIDVGGESTRPGSDRVDLEEETRRVVPVVRALSGDLPASISVDTYKARVAVRALEAGAYMINDVSALRFDSELVSVLRDAGCPVVLMHMLGEPRTMQADPRYDDVVGEVYEFFAERIEYAVSNGIAEENLIIDPGIGFGKTLAHNLELIRNLEVFRSLGRPVLLGASRKRFLGDILGLTEPKDRVHGSVATTVLATLQGVDIVRVHDVEANAQAAQTARAVFPDGAARRG